MIPTSGAWRGSGSEGMSSRDSPSRWRCHRRGRRRRSSARTRSRRACSGSPSTPRPSGAIAIRRSCIWRSPPWWRPASVPHYFLAERIRVVIDHLRRILGYSESLPWAYLSLIGLIVSPALAGLSLWFRRGWKDERLARHCHYIGLPLALAACLWSCQEPKAAAIVLSGYAVLFALAVWLLAVPWITYAAIAALCGAAYFGSTLIPGLSAADQALIAVGIAWVCLAVGRVLTRLGAAEEYGVPWVQAYRVLSPLAFVVATAYHRRPKCQFPQRRGRVPAGRDPHLPRGSRTPASPPGRAGPALLRGVHDLWIGAVHRRPAAPARHVRAALCRRWIGPAGGGTVPVPSCSRRGRLPDRHRAVRHRPDADRRFPRFRRTWAGRGSRASSGCSGAPAILGTTRRIWEVSLVYLGLAQLVAGVLGAVSLVDRPSARPGCPSAGWPSRPPCWPWSSGRRPALAAARRVGLLRRADLERLPRPDGDGPRPGDRVASHGPGRLSIRRARPGPERGRHDPAVGHLASGRADLRRDPASRRRVVRRPVQRGEQRPADGLRARAGRRHRGDRLLVRRDSPANGSDPSDCGRTPCRSTTRPSH